MKRAEQKEKRRQEILNVGLDLLIRKGYAAVRTADIAKEAGISEGLFFLYFATKEKLYLTLLQIAASGKNNIFAAEAESAICFFEQTAKTVLDYISQQQFAAKLFVLMNRACYDDALPEQAKGFVIRKNDVESAVKRIEQGQKEGDIRSGNATALVIAFFYGDSGNCIEHCAVSSNARSATGMDCRYFKEQKMTFRNTNRQTAIPYLLPVRCVLFLLSFVFLSHFTKLPYSALGKWWTAVAIVCNFITIAILYATLRIKKITVGRLLGYEKGKTKIKSAIFIVTVMLLVGMGGLYLAGLICYAEFPHLDKTMVQPVPLWLAVIVLLLLPISAFMAEDVLYLGYAINLSSLHKRVNVSFAAFFYALQHSFIPFMPDGTFLLYRFLSFLPLTVLICIRKKSEIRCRL